MSAIERHEGPLVANARAIVAFLHLPLLLRHEGPNLVDLNAAAAQAAHALVQQLLEPVPTWTSSRITVSRCVLVMRSAERIELPSTRALMTWVRRASGLPFVPRAPKAHYGRQQPVGPCGIQHVRSWVAQIPRLVRSAALYGPNAAGKTNLLRALQLLQSMVLNSAKTLGESTISHSPF